MTAVVSVTSFDQCVGASHWMQNLRDNHAIVPKTKESEFNKTFIPKHLPMDEADVVVIVTP